MKQDISLRQKTSLRPMLLPRPQLFLRLLAMPAVDLRDFLDRELEENPALELADPAAGTGGGPSPDPEVEPSFRENLLRQFRIETDSRLASRVGEFLIESLDDDGYLRMSVDEAARHLKTTVTTVERVLKQLQSMDPPGIGARDLREALRLQLERRGERASPAVKVVREAWDLLVRRKHREIGVRLRMTPEEVSAAVTEIAGLNPHPSAGHGPATVRYAIPEGSVQREGDGYAVVVRTDHLPRLALNAAYRGLKDDLTISPRERAYVRERYGRAVLLLELLEERARNLQSIFHEIVENQRSFLEGGTLLPLTEKEVAERTGLSVSTVSRAVNGKYLRTPRGCLRVKSLFSGEMGFSLSRHYVQEKMAAVIRAEGQSLSDRRIAEALRRDGITISVRTVNKYRRRMRVLSSYLRS